MNADLRLALRQLRKSPGFAVTAVLTLALAIGANAVVFSVLNALVLRPLNVPHAESLFMLERAFERGSTPSQSYPDYLDLRDRNRSFESLVSYDISGARGTRYRRRAIPPSSGRTWSAAITLIPSAFSLILAGSSIAPTSTERTACPMSS